MKIDSIGPDGLPEPRRGADAIVARENFGPAALDPVPVRLPRRKG